MAGYDVARLLAAPTIEERVARGRMQNSTDDGAIVPFPASWDPELLTSCFRNGGGTAYFGYLNDGYDEGRSYFYRSDEGQKIGLVKRLDRSDGDKKPLPIRVTRVIGSMPKLEVKALDPFLPLYNLPGLAAQPDQHVIVTEGEKAADAATLLFPELVATTWPGGCNAVHKADWRPLAGRKVLIWPDHDQPGWKAAKKLGEILQLIGVAELRVIKTPDRLPKGWDVADHLPEVENV